MNITPATLAAVVGRPVNDNMRSTIRGLLMRPATLSAPHQLYQFLGQAAHESGGWRYDRELWGPTPAQKGYDTRTDLGNTAAADGDGYLYRGRSGFQITGKANYRAFTTWAHVNYASAPDFVANPDLINTDPWEGMASIWFWETHGLTELAQTGNIEAVSRRINGGTNGMADRIKLTVDFGIALSGSKSVRSFQSDHRLVADGVAGPITRAALHKVLQLCPRLLFAL